MLHPWLLLCLFVLCVLTIGSSLGSARTYKIGKLVPILNLKATKFEKPDADKVIWEGVVQLQTERMRLHFTEITASTQAQSFHVVLRDLDDKEVLRIPGSKFTEREDYWTGSIFRGFLIVQIETSNGEIPEGLSFSISEAIVKSYRGDTARRNRAQ